MEVAGANDGWPSQFRFAGDVVVSVMAQLGMLDHEIMLPRPPEELDRKMVPILAKIVGIAFIVFGTIFLVTGLVLLFVHAENATLIGSVFVGGSVLQIILGFVVVRFVPRFMLGIFERLRQKV